VKHFCQVKIGKIKKLAFFLNFFILAIFRCFTWNIFRGYW